MKKVLAVTSKYAQKEVLYANSELYCIFHDVGQDRKTNDNY